MTWAKVSDTFNDDPALIVLPRGVRLLYVELVVWSCKHLTDGVVPRAVVGRITDEPNHDAAVDQLVGTGLLEDNAGNLFLVNYAKEQRTRESVEKDRAEAAYRQERRRLHLRGDHGRCIRGSFCPDGELTQEMSRRDFARWFAGESRGPDPTRPVPTEGKGTGRGRATARTPWGSSGVRPQGFTFTMPPLDVDA